MPEYLVEWTVDIDGDNPHDAARQCWQMIRDPASTASIFDVIEPDGTRHRFDALEEPT